MRKDWYRTRRLRGAQDPVLARQGRARRTSARGARGLGLVNVKRVVVVDEVDVPLGACICVGYLPVLTLSAKPLWPPEARHPGDNPRAVCRHQRHPRARPPRRCISVRPYYARAQPVHLHGLLHPRRNTYPSPHPHNANRLPVPPRPRIRNNSQITPGRVRHPEGQAQRAG